jgi:NAD(P)-dependent dehydrogenase (short-subunit alcohol dehydrogenase family)
MTLLQPLENQTLAGTTAIVTGASRGFGHAITEALAGAGAHVVGVARGRAQFDGDFTPVAADAADPEVANRLIDEHQPHTLVLCAGASPTMLPLHQQTWESFSQNWNVDVAQAFHWTRAALRRPLAPGSTVVVVSSGAALNGSPLSGGYAGAKATVKFVADYAAIESERAGLGIRFVSVLPRLTAATDLGAKAVAAYADRQGVDVEAFINATGPALTAEHVGRSVLELATQPLDGCYLLAAAGLSAVN